MHACHFIHAEYVTKKELLSAFVKYLFWASIPQSSGKLYLELVFVYVGVVVVFAFSVSVVSVFQ